MYLLVSRTVRNEQRTFNVLSHEKFPSENSEIPNLDLLLRPDFIVDEFSAFVRFEFQVERFLNRLGYNQIAAQTVTRRADFC